MDRRRFLGMMGAGSVATATAWTAPSVVRVNAAAASTIDPPQFFGLSEAIGNDFFFTLSIDVARPAGTDIDDRLVALVATNESAGHPATFTTSGVVWDRLATALAPSNNFFDTNNVRASLYTRLVIAGEPGSYTWDFGGQFNTGRCRIVIFAYRGLTAPPQVDTVGVVNSGTSNLTTHSFPSITTAGPQRTVLRAGALSRYGGSPLLVWNSFPAPDAILPSYSGPPDSDGSRALHGSQFVQATAGATGVANGTSNVARKSVRFTLALAPG
ncbi:MAG: hypothetical protein JJU45_16670 [Acidimicrobiia bacterium]|nr:hypothetical protein [Acidimicrobiia bacterium]